MLARKKPTITARPTPQRLKIPVAILIRMFLLGIVSVIACAYAIYRHYTTPYVHMLEPVPTASEIEIETTP